MKQILLVIILLFLIEYRKHYKTRIFLSKRKSKEKCPQEEFYSSMVSLKVQLIFGIREKTECWVRKLYQLVNQEYFKGGIREC